MSAQASAAKGGGSAPIYAISADDSCRIQIWRLWMVFMMPLNHVQYQMELLNGRFLTVANPAWFRFLNFFFYEVFTRAVPPAFALVSAVLLYRKPYDWRKNAVRKFRALMMPLILLTSFWIALYAIGPHLPGIGGLFSSSTTRVADWTALDWFTAYFGWTSKHQMPTLLYPLWFMRDLMVMNLLAPAIKWIIDRLPRLCLCALAVMLLWPTNNNFYLHTVHQVFIFFCLGYYLVKYDLHFSHLDRLPKALLPALYALTVAATCLASRIFNVEVREIRGLHNLVCVLFMARCLTPVPTGKWKQRFLWLAEYNTAVYLFHERMLTFAKKIIVRVLPPTFAASVIYYYIFPVATAAVCFCIGWFLRKYQPRFYRFITGSR